MHADYLDILMHYLDTLGHVTIIWKFLKVSQVLLSHFKHGHIVQKSFGFQ